MDTADDTLAEGDTAPYRLTHSSMGRFGHVASNACAHGDAGMVAGVVLASD